MNAIETTGLTKRYGRLTAVDSVDMAVDSGEVFGFLGPNGAGKSTTINLLLDFVRPTAGSATVFGHDVRTRTAAVRRRVGVLPEGISLYDELTAREHLRATIRMKGVTDDPDALLDRVGLADDADRRASEFSTGMGQRLALAMALSGDPELLILDEPSTGLDPRGVQLMREIIRDRVDAGATVFFSSHILGQVEAVCDRVGIMNNGRLVAVDTIEGLRETLGATTRVVFALDERAAGRTDTAGIESIRTDVDGVESVSIDGTRVTVAVETGTAKLAVIERVNYLAPVVDVEVEKASLEALFNEITDNPSGGDGRAATAGVDR